MADVTVKLGDRGDLDFLLQLVTDYREAVRTGEISGYGQSKEDELAYVDSIVKALDDAS